VRDRVHAGGSGDRGRQPQGEFGVAQGDLGQQIGAEQAELAAKAAIDAKLLEVWNELPPFFISSSESKVGRDEIWEFIKGTLPN
jgi:hypothetical protein